MAQLFFGGDGSPQDVIQFLGRQEKHWKEKFSAYETACSWFDAEGLRPAIQSLLQTDSTFADAKLSKAYFERSTELDDFRRSPSQTDVLAFVHISSGLGVLGVEGKVNESFGQIVSDWNDYSPGKLRRLAGLIERLGLRPSVKLGSLRYQLFHRTVATILEAQRANARDAAMVVQSFSPDDVRTGFKDFQDFASALGMSIPEPGKLSEPLRSGDVRLRLGWAVSPMRSVGKA